MALPVGLARAAMTAAAAAVLVACTPAGGPTPSTPSGTPSAPSVTASESAASPDPSTSAVPTLSPAEEEALIADAIAALEEYTALANRIENNGGEGWEELEAWWGTEQLLDGGRNTYRTMQEQGRWTEGDTALSVIETAVLPSDATEVIVRARVCIDTSRVVQFEGDGTVRDVDDPVRFPVESELALPHEDQRWMFIHQEAELDQSC